MVPIRFTIPGPPQGKARARTYYNSKLGRSVSHTPDGTVLYENLIRMCYGQISDFIFEGETPISIRITAFFQPAKSTTKKRLAEMLAGNILPTKKPDADNVAKVVLDALNGCAYGDDKQVVKLEVIKRYDVHPRVEVELNSIEK